MFHQHRQSQLLVGGDAGSTTSGELRTGPAGDVGGSGGGYTSDLLAQSAMVAADLASMLPSNTVGLGLGKMHKKFSVSNQKRAKRAFGIGCVKGWRILWFVVNDLRDGWTNLDETFMVYQVWVGERPRERIFWKN